MAVLLSQSLGSCLGLVSNVLFDFDSHCEILNMLGMATKVLLKCLRQQQFIRIKGFSKLLSAEIEDYDLVVPNIPKQETWSSKINE